ncbi:MAG: hypothetical protein RLZZ184_14 [Cyanobacteriota bacterium]|jgi:hypothetical protein
MTHPLFSVKFLIKKGISYCKMVAKELGVTPVGDKRQVITWADAIVSHQANLQPVEIQKQQVVIEYNDGLADCDLAGYNVVDLDGNILRNGFRTYAAAERWAVDRFELLDQQSIAQQSLVDLLESQIQEVTEKLSIVEIDFGYAEVCQGKTVVATISHNFDNGNWEVQFSETFKSFLTYAEAEAFAINYIDERGSGRILPISQDIEEISYGIENNCITDPLGERYTVRFKGHLAGNIWLDVDKGWTLGSDYYNDPMQAAKALVNLTKKELVA